MMTVDKLLTALTFVRPGAVGLEYIQTIISEPGVFMSFRCHGHTTEHHLHLYVTEDRTGVRMVCPTANIDMVRTIAQATTLDGTELVRWVVAALVHDSISPKKQALHSSRPLATSA